MDSKTFYRCPKCGTLAPVDTSISLASCPPQYSYYCPYCKQTGYVFCSDVIAASNGVYTLCDGATYYPED